MNLYEKMSAIMDTIEYLGKDGQIDFGKTKYKAISEEKVTTMVRKELIKHKLVVFPIEQSRERIGTLTSVDIKYKMVNAENPEEYIILASSGEGADSQDKGVGKAMTYAYKYMLLRTFGIPTGEDPDKISSDELDEMFKKAEAQKKLESLSRTEKEDLVVSLCDKKGKKVASMCAWAEVTELAEMSDEKLDEAIAMLNR